MSNDFCQYIFVVCGQSKNENFWARIVNLLINYNICILPTSLEIIYPKENAWKVLMKFIFNLNETLISSHTLNNEPYIYALKIYGYPRMNTVSRVTIDDLAFILFKCRAKMVRENWSIFQANACRVDIVKHVKTENLMLKYIWYVNNFWQWNCNWWIVLVRGSH